MSPSTTTNVRSHITTLESFHNRFYTEPGNQKAIEYLCQTLANFGLETEKDFFYYQNRRYCNIITRLNGKSKKTYLVCAHFDSKAKKGERFLKKAPGADDNASGVAALLELAKILKHKKGKDNLYFAFFNLEEQQRKGSKHFARNTLGQNKKINGVINLDTIGTWKKPISKDLPVNYVSDQQSTALLNSAKRSFPYPLRPAKEPWLDDHASFWEKGIPAIELTQDGCTPYMHTTQDTSEKLHYENINKIVNGLKCLFEKI